MTHNNFDDILLFYSRIVFENKNWEYVENKEDIFVEEGRTWGTPSKFSKNGSLKSYPISDSLM